MDEKQESLGPRNNLPHDTYSRLLEVPASEIRRMAMPVGYCYEFNDVFKGRSFRLEKRPNRESKKRSEPSLSSIVNGSASSSNGSSYRYDLWSKLVTESHHRDIHQREIAAYSGTTPEPAPGQISLPYLFQVWSRKFNEAHPAKK